MFKNFVTVSLPNGSYVVTATAALSTLSTSMVSAQCMIRGSRDSFLSSDIQGTMGGGLNNFQEITVTSGFFIGTGQDVSLACRGSSAIQSQPSAITAIRVGTVIDQSQ